MRPFEGIRVIDATHVVAGPFATYQLAVLGADVIKVERPDDPDQSREQGGDAEIRHRGMGTQFLSQNSSKRSLTLNLKRTSGRDAFLRLVASSDVLVENYRPGAFADLGLDPATLNRANPRLIHCSISAFGQSGPRGPQTAYDSVIQASSGLMAMTGTPECNPIKIGSPVVDYATGMSAAFAISSALFQREKTGHGQRIDLAMFDTALTLMGISVTAFEYSGVEPRPAGNGHSPTVACYDTRDGLLMIAAANRHQKACLWEALGCPERATSASDEEDRAAESKLLGELFLSRTADEWEAFLQARHVPAARVRTMKEALHDPQLTHRRVFQRLEECPGVERAFTVPLAPFVFERDGPAVDGPPRILGSDTEAILADLGYSSSEIEAIVDERAGDA